MLSSAERVADASDRTLPVVVAVGVAVCAGQLVTLVRLAHGVALGALSGVGGLGGGRRSVDGDCPDGFTVLLLGLVRGWENSET